MGPRHFVFHLEKYDVGRVTSSGLGWLPIRKRFWCAMIQDDNPPASIALNSKVLQHPVKFHWFVDGFGNRTKQTEKSYWLPQVQQNVGAHLNLESVLDVSRSKKSVDKSKNDEISSPCLVAVRRMNNYSYPPRKTNMAMENHPSLVGDTVHLQIIRGFSMAM